MSDLTNYDGRLEAMTGYCEAMYLNLAKVENVYSDVEETVYSKTLPSKYMDFFGIKKIGGKTILWNQLCKNGNFADSSGWGAINGTLAIASNVATITAGSSGSTAIVPRYDCPFVLNHKYFVRADAKFSVGANFYISVAGNTSSSGSCSKNVAAGDWVTVKGIFTNMVGDSNSLYLMATRYEGETYQYRNVNIFDLTLMFGAGNEPTTVQQFETMFNEVYYADDSGSLLSAGVTEVVSKDADDATLETFTVPEDITTMECYGWSCPGAYNYIDFDAKQFVQAVGSRAYEAGDESDATVITDGTNTHYELDEPLAFDVELPDENITKAEAGGTLTFENEHKIPVPVELEYIGVA